MVWDESDQRIINKARIEVKSKEMKGLAVWELIDS